MRRQPTATPRTPMERRALLMAEAALEASGLRYMSAQIDGLARLFVVFAENEIEKWPRPGTGIPKKDVAQ